MNIKTIKTKWNQISKHPLFSIMVFMFVMILIRIFGNIGILKGSTIDFISIVWIYSIVGLGYSLLLGYTGLASLGTAGFIGIGSYVVSYLFIQTGLPLVFIFIIGFVVAILSGIAIGFISLRIEGMYLAIITLGLSEILVEVFRKARTITNGDGGLQVTNFNIFGATSGEAYWNNLYWVITAFLILLMIAFVNIVNSPTGRAMLSVKNSTSAAQAMGISILKYRLLAFVIATITAVLGGMLYLPYMTKTEPSLWNIGLSLNILAAVIIGGSKSIWGVILGTFIIFGLKDVILVKIPYFASNGNAIYFFTGAVVILIVMYYPGGLIKLFDDLKRKLLSIKKKTKLEDKA